MEAETRRGLFILAIFAGPSVILLTTMMTVLQQPLSAMNHSTAIVISSVAFGVGMLVMLAADLRQSFAWRATFNGGAFACFDVFLWMMSLHRFWIALAVGTVLLGLVAAITAQFPLRRRTPYQVHPDSSSPYRRPCAVEVSAPPYLLTPLGPI
ncbi:MAG: hypothetical protein OJF49_003057 [Ktedonobacterales bacterium]|jgi:chromate transport protein ChrA|nr:MAG: hypothetical protein OJF49_003057 [Ktedonobacterales bacterium]